LGRAARGVQARGKDSLERVQGRIIRRGSQKVWCNVRGKMQIRNVDGPRRTLSLLAGSGNEKVGKVGFTRKVFLMRVKD